MIMWESEFYLIDKDGEAVKLGEATDISRNDNGLLLIHRKKIKGMLQLQLQIIWLEIKELPQILKPGGSFRGMRWTWLRLRFCEIARGTSNLFRIIITRKWEGRK